MLALVAFLVLDAVLVAWALGAHRAATEVEPDAVPIVTPQPGGSTSPSASASPSASSPAESAAIAPEPSTHILSALDAEVAWRALTGPCPQTEATPQLTTDGGASWRDTDATAPTGVTSLQRIVVEAPDVATMVALRGTDCTPTLIRTFVAGDNYEEYPDELAGAWFVDPADRSRVQSPTGSATAPCESVVALAARDGASALVLCADGSLATTSDSGASWSAAVPAPGVQAIGNASAGFIAAAVGREGCAGIQVLQIDAASAASSATGCLLTDIAPADFAGVVAIAEAASTVWLWAGDLIQRSSDGGASWS
ncbi:hypothetical protein [Yonghaparkia sp. Root332]|uniref:hypothetical protein n=1 Tax=Yonghaparkia sp. Root332 TaxID=1736516 RepID=UPI0012E362DF|nr:hypothetical protein [Yonghaparkia sp. Root332]